ncbi:hypothetical protein KQ307_04035 [Synechococcus sp. CS-1326]|uniref:hypothetical protein n=1 Tax=Synechococcus sp. CS-1326 TaxID=2847978 RepID=UPI00223B8801|nr:hypothetical protein [Synechococcus sp. CS-1326]MCT0212672.1 hypothetical protein [Synechococcus sp. CS-1326]
MRLLLISSGSGLDDLADSLAAAGDWKVEIVDPIELDWLPWDPGADDPLSPTDLDGSSLLRLSGLNRAEPGQASSGARELPR